MPSAILVKLTVSIPPSTSRTTLVRAGGGEPWPQASRPPSTTTLEPGDVGAGLGGEEGDRLAHLLGAPQPAQRHLPARRLERLRRRSRRAPRCRCSRAPRRPSGSRDGSTRARVPARGSPARPGRPRRARTRGSAPRREAGEDDQPAPPGIIERVATSRVSSHAASTARRWTARIPSP